MIGTISNMINTVSDVMALALSFLIACLGVVALTIAAHIPYWSRTDRDWKLSISSDEDEPALTSTDGKGAA